MKRLFLLLSIAAFFSCEKPNSAPPTGGDKVAAPENTPEEENTPALPPIIVGYATYWDTAIPDPTLLTHINYAFAHIKNDFESLEIKKETGWDEFAKEFKDVAEDVKSTVQDADIRKDVQMSADELRATMEDVRRDVETASRELEKDIEA